MIFWDKLKKALNDKLGLSYWVKVNNQLVCRCPYCELKSTKNHGHLYIYKNEEGEVPTFHCFRCGDDGNGHGTLFELLDDLKLDYHEFIDNDIHDYVYPKFKSGGIKKYNPIHIPVSIYGKLDEDKYNSKKLYLQGRLGFNIDFKKIPNLVFDIKSIINTYPLKDPTYFLEEKSFLLDIYEKYYVGFLSNMNTILSLRNTDHKSKYRYSKIYFKTDIEKDFYGIFINKPNINNTIVLSEGVFDLLTALNSEDLLFLKNKSLFWAAILGSGYTNMIDTILNYCKVVEADIVILSDTDKTFDYYKNIKYNPRVRSLNIFWNKDSKDFGELPIRIIQRKL